MKFWQRHVTINECKLLMLIAIAIILSKYGTKEVDKGEKVCFSSWNNNYILRLKRAKGRKPRKNGREPGMLGQEEGGLGPCPSPLNRNDQGAQWKKFKNTLWGHQSLFFSHGSNSFSPLRDSRVIATCTPVPTWVHKKVLQTGAHQLKHATPSLCSLKWPLWGGMPERGTYFMLQGNERVGISLVNPLNPKIKIWILICCPYSFPTDVVGRGW